MSLMNKKYELIIMGGGISGTTAGIAAAREGVKTLIVEKNGYLGGMLTAAGVGPMMTFHAGKEQVIQGITGELIERLSSSGLSTGHIFDTTGYTYSVTPFDMEGMKYELEQMYLEAGGELLYHTMLADVDHSEDRITAIQVCNKSGLSRLEAPYFIDASGDADLCAWSGVPFLKGRIEDGVSQPMTMKLRMYGVDIPRVREYIHDHPEEFPRLKGDTGLIDRADRLSIGGFVKTLEAAKKAGDISFSREDILFFETNNPGEVIINTSRITGLDSTDPFELTRAEIEGRRQARELTNFFHKWVPGFENAVLCFTGPSVGVRSSRQIVGLYTVTKEDILAGRKFEDAVVCNGYPIDIHSPSGEGTFHSHLAWGEFYTLPYRSLVNGKVANLLTVGRCISGDFEAQAAFRTTPGAGAIGHAGGAAAAAAVKSGQDFPDVPYGVIRDLLLKQGAFLP